jgi:hypothetical protein
MFPLIETAIGFVAVMLMLTLLVKSVTELIKAHFDFYCDNLAYEADQFFRAALGRSLASLQRDPRVRQKLPWLSAENLSRIGDEFFNEENARAALGALESVTGTQVDPVIAAHLKGVLAAHVSRVTYTFNQRMKNLAFAVGVGLCLLLDVNAITIWRTLYTHDQLRTTFSSPEMTSRLLGTDAAGRRTAASTAPNAAASGTANTTPGAGTTTATTPGSATANPTPPAAAAATDASPVADEEAQLAEARRNFRDEVTRFTSEVNFGVARVWRGEPPLLTPWAWMMEFLGALVTGLLVSVGAPYWHDILENLGALRRSEKP